MMSLRLFQRFGRLLYIFAGLFALNSLICLMMFQLNAALSFFFMASASGFSGFVFVMSSAIPKHVETNVDALLFLIMFWIVAPIMAAVPFAMIGPNMTVASLLFEGVGAITTSGASAFLPSELSPALLIWRGLAQFLGGVSVTTFAIVILASLNMTGTGVHRSLLFTYEHENLFARIISIGKVVGIVYFGLVILSIAVLLLGGATPFHAMCLALGGVSTGGLSPIDGPLATILSPIGAFLFSVICLFGAFNFAVIWDVLRLRSIKSVVRIFTNVEHRALLVLIGILLLVSVLYFNGAHIIDSLIEAIFFVSTTGFDYNIIALEMTPSILLIIFALVGGSALSTAGGLKIIRLLLLFRHLETDLSRLSHPSRVFPVKFRGQLIRDRSFVSIWMYFFGYTLVFGLGILSFAASNIEFESAVTLSAGMLSNMAPLLQYTFSDSTLLMLDDGQKLVAVALMYAGRVEVLAIFALLSTTSWRNR
ncbi:MAG: potassium transporter TrkG [Maricaulaceae bacterium]